MNILNKKLVSVGEFSVTVLLVILLLAFWFIVLPKLKGG